MKSLEVYGTSLVKYEGAAELAFPEWPGIIYKSYFEAKQMTSGAIAVGYVPIKQESDGSKPTSGSVHVEVALRGRDPDGWEIEVYGQSVAWPLLGLVDAMKSSTYPAGVFRSQSIRARRKGATANGYNRVQFLVSNLLWHYTNAPPEPITLEVGGLTLTITPIDAYLEVAESIKALRGTAPTAQVSIKTTNASNLSLKRFGDFMNYLVSVFRLATGNRVDWYYGEALEIGTERVVERYHKDAVTGPFSRVVKFRPLKSGWVSLTQKLDFTALAESFLGNDKRVLDRNTLKELIDYFINACDETSYLEPRGLLASTLLDLIVLKYARVTKADSLMEEAAFRKDVLPKLKKALEDVQLPKLEKELRTSAINQLSGAYRRSFRKRLDLLTKELDLPLDSKARRRAVDIRNKLVHDGTYLSGNRDDWYSEYQFMIWVDLVALCRLAGYKGDLPLPNGRSSLEV